MEPALDVNPHQGQDINADHLLFYCLKGTTSVHTSKEAVAKLRFGGEDLNHALCPISSAFQIVIRKRKLQTELCQASPPP